MSQLQRSELPSGQPKRKRIKVKIQVGDIMQVDGGLVIIKEVETVRAFCLPLPGFKNLKADIFKHGFGVEQASRNVLERRGEAGLAAFLAEQKQAEKAERNSMVRLEPGDALCYHGHRCTVVAVVEDGALLQNAAGEEFEEAREVNEFLFADCSCKGHVAGRLDAAGRAENLRKHNEAMAAGVAEAAADSDGRIVLDGNNDTETKKEPKMKANKTKTETKAKTKEAKTAKPAAERGVISQKDFVESLCDGKHTKSEAAILCMKKYGTTEKAAKGAVNNCRFFQKKEGRKLGEWKD